ncbi:MAG: hypothetical protein U1F35_05570 [Steroidobacteraceae bacterium]
MQLCAALAAFARSVTTRLRHPRRAPAHRTAGTARLRLSITLNAMERDIDALVEALAAEREELPA